MRSDNILRRLSLAAAAVIASVGMLTLSVSVIVTLSLSLAPDSLARKVTVKVKVDKKGRTPADARGEERSGEAGRRWISAGDSVCEGIARRVTFSGYDKTLSARKETFLVTNTSAVEITGLRLTIDYFDLGGHQLHRREEIVAERIPAGQTRIVDITSFDTQQSYYYYKSKVPRKSATPYRVEIRLEGIEGRFAGQ